MRSGRVTVVERGIGESHGLQPTAAAPIIVGAAALGGDRPGEEFHVRLVSPTEGARKLSLTQADATQVSAIWNPADLPPQLFR
jgi:hypothetical protein